MGNGCCVCNSETGDVPASKCEFKVDISDNSLLLNNNNNNNINNQSKIIEHNNNSKDQNNEFLENIFPGGDNINNFFENKEKALQGGNGQIQNNLNTSNDNNYINTNNDSNIEKIKNNQEPKETIEEEDEEEKKSSSKSQNIEKGNDKILKFFDNFIKDHAEYIDETVYEKKLNPKVKEIENNLEIIEEKFESEILNLKLFKRGPLLFKNNNMIYNGSWNSKFLKEGFGIAIDKDGNKYTGNWKDDKFEGNGRLISINGDYYEGNWICGNMEGYGIFQSMKNETKYEGEFKDNKFNGNGKLTYGKEKIIYEGNFLNGLKEGKGKMIFGNKEIYEGDFKSDCFCGEGTFIWADGRKYTGEWKNNFMDGKGEFIFDNNTKYKGEYKENKKDGKGAFYQGNIYYEGEWLNNMPHGEGKIFVDNKNVVSGIFRYGKLVNTNQEGIQNEKKEKGQKKDKKTNEEDFEEGLKLNNKKVLETDIELNVKNKIIDNEKNKNNNKPKKISSLNHKVANPLDFKSGFLQKVKQNKK